MKEYWKKQFELAYIESIYKRFLTYIGASFSLILFFSLTQIVQAHAMSDFWSFTIMALIPVPFIVLEYFIIKVRRARGISIIISLKEQYEKNIAIAKEREEIERKVRYENEIRAKIDEEK